MKTVVEFFNDNTNRYSFHFLAWIIYIFLSVYIGLISWHFHIYDGYGGAGDYVAFGTVFALTSIYPLLFGLIMLIYIRLRIKENKNLECRIKNQFVTQNIFCKSFTIFSVLTSLLFFLLLLFFSILGIISNPNDILFIFYEPFDKATICIVVLYLLAFLIK